MVSHNLWSYVIKENCGSEIQKDRKKSAFVHTEIKYFWDSNYEVRPLLLSGPGHPIRPIWG